VQSVLDQPSPAGDVEVIVVNDSGRTLPDADWQASPRVRQIVHQQRGQSAARNAGAAVARGCYLHFLDDDDWLLPGALSAFGELAQRAHQADWLYGGVRMVDDNGRVLGEFNPGLDGNAHVQLMSGVWITLVASLIRSTAFFAANGFDPSLRTGEETDLGRKITLRGDLASTAAVVVCVWRGHGWHASAANASLSPEANRRSRDWALGRPGTFARLQASAHSPYWRGRILQAYLAAAHWNWRRGQYLTSASRGALALLSAALAGSALLSQPYWQALRDEHVPDSSLRVFATLSPQEP
jgi:glycosyltransferase involved in cell wall biosynthesis